MQPQVVEVAKAVRARPGTQRLQPAVSERLVTPRFALQPTAVRPKRCIGALSAAQGPPGS